MSERCKHCGRTIVLWRGDGKLWVHKDDGRVFCSMDDDDNNHRAKPSPEPEAAPEGKGDAERIVARIRSKIEMEGATPEDWVWEALAVLEADGKLKPQPPDSEAQAPAVPRAAWNALMEEETKESIAKLYLDSLAELVALRDKLATMSSRAIDVEEHVIPALREKLAQAERGLDLTTRLLRDDYPIRWQHAGGPNECKHGFATGIPCRDCDLELLDDLVTAREGKTAMSEQMWIIEARFKSVGGPWIPQAMEPFMESADAEAKVDQLRQRNTLSEWRTRRYGAKPSPEPEAAPASEAQAPGVPDDLKERLAKAMMHSELVRRTQRSLDEALAIPSEMERTFRRMLVSGEVDTLIENLKRYGLRIAIHSPENGEQDGQ